MPQPKAIGLSGFATCGKTTAANHLTEKYGYTLLQVAGPLRAMLRTMMIEARVPESLIDRYLTGDLKHAVIPEFGKTSRELQISLGTEWGRELVKSTVWSDIWLARAKDQRFAMNDSVRFPSEEDAVNDLNGACIMIIRPGLSPVAYSWGTLGRLLYKYLRIWWGVHPSERTDLLRPYLHIVNDGTVNDLKKKVDRALLLIASGEGRGSIL